MTMVEHRSKSVRSHCAELGQQLSRGMATFVLALTTGVPMRSVKRLLPDPDDTTTPYLGI